MLVYQRVQIHDIPLFVTKMHPTRNGLHGSSMVKPWIIVDLYTTRDTNPMFNRQSTFLWLGQLGVVMPRNLTTYKNSLGTGKGRCWPGLCYGIKMICFKPVILDISWYTKSIYQMLHVWNIYLHLGDFWANVGKYSIDGAYGIPWLLLKSSAMDDFV
jgi:hypothetical protein